MSERRGKYNARKQEADGYVFDSQAEARHYIDELRPRFLAGEIVGLIVHPVYELQPAFRDRNGKHIRPITYEADFEYSEHEDRVVVVDVKGVRTETFRLKAKMFQYMYPMCELRIV